MNPFRSGQNARTTVARRSVTAEKPLPRHQNSAFDLKHAKTSSKFDSPKFDKSVARPHLYPGGIKAVSPGLRRVSDAYPGTEEIQQPHPGRHARQVQGIVMRNHRVLVNRARKTTETLIATDVTEKICIIISVESVVLSALSGKNRYAKITKNR